MTRREQLKEIEIPLEEEHIKKLEERGVSIEAILEGYIDAIKYGWDTIIEEDQKASALYHVRTVLLQMIHEIDEQLDDITERKSEGDENCN